VTSEALVAGHVTVRWQKRNVFSRNLNGSVSIVRRFDSPEIQLKLKLALTLSLTLTDTGGAVLTLTDRRPSDCRSFGLSSRHHLNDPSVSLYLTVFGKERL